MRPDLSRKTFGFVMFDAVEELDLVGPWEIATMWRDYAKGPRCVAVAERAGPMRCAKGLTMTPDAAFADAEAFDYLLVPGGFSALTEAENVAMTDYVRRVAASAEAVLSVCTGSFILAAAGLLEGRSATTHWKALDRLRAIDGITVREERYVTDGPIWTSAGVSAGIDMSLAFVAATAGDEAAGVVQHNAEYYPDPHVYGPAPVRETAPGYVRSLVT